MSLKIIKDDKVPYSSENPLNGAFSYIQSFYQTQEISPIFVQARNSSKHEGTLDPKDTFTADVSTTSYWCSNNVENSWFEIYFNNNFFYLESYTIRAYYKDFFSEYKVLGSNDGYKYDLIDEKSDLTEPPSSPNFPSIHYECKYPKARKMFKFIPKGKKFGENYRFCIYNIDLFGRFKSKSNNQNCSCKNRIFVPSFILAIINTFLCL